MIICGKWSGQKYKVLDFIGKGGIAEIYLVEEYFSKKEYAIKICRDFGSLISEFNILKDLDMKWIPKVYLIDDFCLENKTYCFVVMDFIKGKDLKEVIRRQRLTSKEIIGLAIIINKIFMELFERGYIYCDLKMENIILDEKNKIFKMLDFGSVVRIGESIKEYTPCYDRASWNMGDRVADAKFSIFALSIFMVYLLLGRLFDPVHNSIKEVIRSLRTENIEKSLVNILENGLYQKYENLAQFQERLKSAYYNEKKYRCDGFLNLGVVLSTSIFIFLIFKLYNLLF